MSESQQDTSGLAEKRYIRFAEEATNGDILLMSFKDPARRHAFLTGNATVADPEKGTILVVRLLPLEAKLDHTDWLEKDGLHTTLPVHVKLREAQLLWHPGRAVLQCDAQLVDTLLLALVEFAHYEEELRRFEREIADSWNGLEEDRGLAFDVTPSDLRRTEVVGKRMEQTFRRRIHFARMETSLYAPSPALSAIGMKLGEELREKARMEERSEAVSDQIEVFEHIYEMSSQRIGEYKASRQSSIIEWIIIVLLAAETLLMLAQTIWKTHG